MFADRTKRIRAVLAKAVLATGLSTGTLAAVGAELPQTILAVKPAVVAIATFQKTRSPSMVFFGTGFAVNDGLTIVTNAHVVAPQMDSEKSGTIGVLTGPDGAPDFRPATLISAPSGA